MIKNDAKISILIPIFNVEKFLAQCLDSVLAQSYKNIELICINDGSNDNSLEILLQYVDNHDNIKVINKANSGYGDSMNQGLEIATGKYIAIIESDDVMCPEALATLVRYAEDYSLDAVKGAFNDYWSNREDVKYRKIVNSKLLYKIIAPKDYPHIFRRQASIWSAIYNKDFLNKHNIRFLPTPGASYQDIGFNFKTLAFSQKMMFIPDAIINYRQDNMMSSVKSTDKTFCAIDEINELERIFGQNETLSRILLTRKVGLYLHTMKRLSPGNRLIFLEQEMLNIKKLYSQQSCMHLTLKERVYLSFLANTPRLFIRYLK